jgi:hypothetical protein
LILDMHRHFHEDGYCQWRLQDFSILPPPIADFNIYFDLSHANVFPLR